MSVPSRGGRGDSFGVVRGQERKSLASGPNLATHYVASTNQIVGVITSAWQLQTNRLSCAYSHGYLCLIYVTPVTISNGHSDGGAPSGVRSGLSADLSKLRRGS